MRTHALLSSASEKLSVKGLSGGRVSVTKVSRGNFESQQLTISGFTSGVLVAVTVAGHDRGAALRILKKVITTLS